MSAFIFIILRRLRIPLLVLVVAYAIAVLGFVLIPGQDENGNIYHMDFFHAFYVVSYLSTTIGLGEIPYPLTAAQRLWSTFSIYTTVIAWLYAIGNIFALMQEKLTRQILREQSFEKWVRRNQQPFYIVAGYGETGSSLINALVKQGVQAVVLDNKARQIDKLRLEEHAVYIPALCANASDPRILEVAGLTHPRCQGIIAVTNADQANLHIAITSKLLNPSLFVIARAARQETADNMGSFGTDFVINPFHHFADRVFTALNTPAISSLHEWLAGLNTLDNPLSPPHGRWIICGYGRFGKAIFKRFQQEGIETVIIESKPDQTGLPRDAAQIVEGWGTETKTLLEAGLEEATGIVAGTDYDTNNLSILMTAREIKPDLYTIARQNLDQNLPLFEAFKPNIIAQESATIAHVIRLLINTPMLKTFIDLSRKKSNLWAEDLNADLVQTIGPKPPCVWEISFNHTLQPNIALCLEQGITLEAFLKQDRERASYEVRALMLERDGQYTLLPDRQTLIEYNDKLLIISKSPHFKTNLYNWIDLKIESKQ